LNKDLELRVHFTIHSSISNLLFTSGMVGIISNQNIIFLNLLGGNQILLQCLNNNNILDAVHDSVNNYLYVIDTSGYLLIYNTKLTLSKSTHNECNIIYKIKLVNSKVSQCKLELTRSILYIILDNKFIGVIDLALLDKSGFVVNRFYITSKLKFNKFLLEYSLLPLSPGKDSLLAIKLSDYDVITVRLIHHDTNTAKVEKGFMTYLEENVLYIYGVVMLVVLYVFFTMKKTNEPGNKVVSKDEEPLNADDHKLLEQMFSKIQGVKNPGKMNEPIDEEDYEEDEEEDMEDRG
jgi:hypothetical protein